MNGLNGGARPRLVAALSATLAFGVCASAALPATADPIVTTAAGRIAGKQLGSATVYHNIPYAVAARWEAPKAAARWQGVRSGAHPGPICPQRAESPLAAMPQSEDCLNLNVWVPSGHHAKSLPVMFWIHGGSFRVGSGSSPLYDGQALVSRNVILVSINYRLGVLGRFALPELSKEQAGQPRADYGLMDQIAALKWVKRNIGAFGGDPANVTIFGYSAGGVSVNYLMTAPGARGLFAKAIAESGGIQIDTTQHISERRPGPLGASLEEQGEALAKNFGADGAPASLARLRTVPAADLIAYQEKHAMGSLNPVVDGILIPDDIGRAFSEGKQARVPYMAGSTSWEASLIHYVPRPLPPRMVLSGIADVEAARAAFGGLDDAALANAWFADSVFLGTAHYLTRASARIGEPSYLYYFDYVPTALRGTVPGAAHGDEVPFIFGTLPAKVRNLSEAQITPEDRKVSALMTAYWTNFAKSGNPNGAGLPQLIARDPASYAINVLDQAPRVISDFKAGEMKFLDAYYAEHMGGAK